MFKNKNNYVTGQSKPMIQCLFLLGVGAFSSVHATEYVYPGSTNNYNFNTGDTLTVESGTFSQGLNLSSTGITITVENGATFSPSYFNVNAGSGNRLIIESGAAAALSGYLNLKDGFTIDNSGHFSAPGINFNGNAGGHIINRAKIDGFDEPVFSLSSSFQLSGGSTIDNQGLMVTTQDFNTANGSTLTNSGTIEMATFQPSGDFINNGFISASNKININSQGNIVNNCTFVADEQIYVNSALTNNGIFFVNKSVHVNGSGVLHQSSAGYTEGADFSTDGKVTGSGNYYFTGNTKNQGSFGLDADLGLINFYDTTLNASSAKFFDTQPDHATPLRTTKNQIESITKDEALTHCTYASIVTELSLDFGDAPASYGDASHIITGNIYIGSNPPDAETSGQADATATGDDSNGSTTDDEDGVSFPEMEQGQQVSFSIPVNGQDRYLQAWIDWNGDGDFSDTDEQVATNLQDNGILSDSVTGDGTIDVLITAPDDATTETTYARFRWSTDIDLGSQGQATDGEVEDYTLTIDVAEVNASCTINDIASNGYSSASPSASSRFLSDKTYVYTATFNSSDWSSEVLAYDLNIESNEGGTKSVVWNSSTTISSIGRSLFTYNPDAETASGSVLSWDNLSGAQQSTLAGSDGEEVGEARVDWLFGQTSNLRQRSHLLGDIINSSLTIKAPLTNYGYQALSGTEGTSYASFLQSKVSSTTSLFVGSNNGMFHALDAESGEELFAYVPNEVLSKIPTISDVKYGCSEDDCLPHEYLIDGKSTLGDAYLSNAWSSVVIGTLGLGGRGLFALDVTDPDNFSSSDVLWEISAAQAPDNESVFANHLGYTLPSASIVRAPNGQWLAITGNGYDSESKQAVLFIIDLETGELVKAINTMSGSTDTPNGLSTPTVVDSDGDAIADRIYAGDLLGNVWAFDISSTNSDDWSVVYGSDTMPESLFRACSDNACLNPQPITAAPQVSKNKVAGLMVYVGTGKYTDIADGLTENTEAEFDTFYGIQDNGSVVVRSDLVEQEMLAEVAVSNDLNSRITSNNTVDYTTKRGWFLDLQTPPNGTNEGERVVSQAILSGGRIIFTTLIPSAASCSFSGESWIMELNAQDGSRLSVITFDLNNDLIFTSTDNSTYDGSPTTVSGVQQPSLGIVRSTPVIVANTTSAEGKYVTGSEGGIGMFRESASDFRGRMSWRNISN